jgi:hypothetical protein
MNQNSITVNLLDFTNDDHPRGNIQGKETFRKLVDFIDSNPFYCIFGISLVGIIATDATFPRESVISIAKQYRGEKGLFLEGVQNRDLIDNWKYAASAKEQPIVIWSDDNFEIIGPEISSSTIALINYVLDKRSVFTSQVANDLHMSVQNASTRLKNLVNQGYIMRSEVVAESGGIEYAYHAIR